MRRRPDAPKGQPVGRLVSGAMNAKAREISERRSGLLAGGGRVCRLGAGMGRGRSGFFLSVEGRIVTGNDKK